MDERERSTVYSVPILFGAANAQRPATRVSALRVHVPLAALKDIRRKYLYALGT